MRGVPAFMRNYTTYAMLIAVSYLWGSICWGLVFSFVFRKEDIRAKDNPGFSGSVRQYGWFHGLTVGILDALKGYALSLTIRLLTVPEWVLIVCLTAVVVGHNWPIFFQFRGGGGIATAVGILAQGYLPGLLWALPFAAVAAALWKLIPALKARTHISPFISAVGAVPCVIWFILNKSWYPDYIIVATLAACMLGKGLQFHIRAQKQRTRESAHAQEDS